MEDVKAPVDETPPSLVWGSKISGVPVVFQHTPWSVAAG